MPHGGTAFRNPPYFQLVVFLASAASFAIRHFRDVHLLIR
jgi:hypothetical protein